MSTTYKPWPGYGEEEWIEVQNSSTRGDSSKWYRLYVGGCATRKFKRVYPNRSATSSKDITVVYDYLGDTSATRSD